MDINNIVTTLPMNYCSPAHGSVVVWSTVGNFITDAATLPHMEPLRPMVVTIGWPVLTLLVNCKHYFLCTLLRLLQFSIFLWSEEGCCEYPKQRYQSLIDTLEPVIYATKIVSGKRNNFDNSYGTAVTRNNPFSLSTTRAIFATTSMRGSSVWSLFMHLFIVLYL